MAVRRLRQGRMRVATVSTPTGSSVSAGTEKRLILLRRFYTRSAAAGSKYRLVKVSPASVRGMSIGDDPTARPMSAGVREVARHES